MEQVPNQYLKVQTQDGSCVICPLDEVVKITKELPKNNGSFGPSAGFGESATFKSQYDGVFDFGYSIDVRSQGTGRISFSTTHGCLLLPYLYIGGGLGFDFYHTGRVYGVPLFANLRGYFVKDREVRPYLNARIGYSVGDIEGLYLVPTVGLTYGHLDLSVGYAYQEAKMYYFDGPYIWHTGAVTIKIGWRFR